MSFNLSTNKADDFSVKLKAQNYANMKEQSRKLEIDNEKMEERLRELKLAMNRERAEREQSQGGPIWLSGQKGSISTYARDVLKKPAKPGLLKPNADMRKIRVLKDEPVVVPDRAKGPGTTAFIAQRTGQGSDGAMNEKDRRQRCGQCEEKIAQVSCIECGEDYCARCFAAFHLKGALKKHRSTPVGVGNIRTPRDTRRSSIAAGETDRELRAPDTNGSTMGRGQRRIGGISDHGDSRDTRNNEAGSKLCEGTYNEEENAAAFQEAVKAWRQQTNDRQPSHPQQPKPSAAARKPVGVELGTSTDSGNINDLPIEIKFTSSLTYAEKLLLKKHRRNDLPTPRFCESASDVRSSSRDADKYQSLSARTLTARDGAGEGGDYYDELQHLEDEQSGDSTPVERNESRISIIELSEISASDRLLEKTSTYEVSNCGNDTPPSPPSSRAGETAKPRRSAFTRSAKVPEGSKFSPRPPESVRKSQEKSIPSDSSIVSRSATTKDSSVLGDSANSVVKTKARSSRQISSRSEKEVSVNQKTNGQVRSAMQEPGVSVHVSGVSKDQHSKENSPMKVPSDNRSSRTSQVSTSRSSSVATQQSQVLLSSTKLSETSELSPRPSTDGKINKISGSVVKTEQTPRKQSATPTPRSNKDGRKSAPDGKLTSRVSSRVSSYGDGALTKNPSDDLRHLAALHLTSFGQISNVSDLGMYFTLGLKSLENDQPGVLSARDGLPSHRSVASTPRVASARMRVSNHLYQMGPRSWKPDASLAANVSSDQAEPIQREMYLMTESVLSPSEGPESDLVDTDARSNELFNDVTSSEHYRSPRVSQVMAAPVGSASTEEAKAAKNVVSNAPRSNSHKTRHPQVAHGLPSTADKTSRLGPWSVQDNDFDPSLDETSFDHDATASFTSTGGVPIKHEIGRNVPSTLSQEDFLERSVTPNMMLPRRSLITPRASSRLASSRPMTPASGRQSQMIVVDGEDLTRFDVVDDDESTEQKLRDEDTLAQLDQELTQHNPDHLPQADPDNAVESENHDHDQVVVTANDAKDSPTLATTLATDEFDLASKLREATLFDDFEEMEAQINEQMQVQTLPLH